MLLVDQSVKAFIEVVESNEPTPGGGSVSALAGSLGAALTAMVGNLTIGRKAFNELETQQQKEIEDNFNLARDLKGKLNILIDEDTKAFNGVMAAFKLPKETEEEKKARREAIEKATIEAMEIPLAAAKECLKVLQCQKTFALYGNVNAITDIGVGALMAYSGLEGALFNVRINLQGLKDEAYAAEIKNTCDTILKQGTQLKDEVIEIVYTKL
ncbi:cyclodeaminase/cyclohydrolase family protein [Alkaliphilus peptidifermentans]|uniref:Formimidoyltetrahydrofolate cyclodeaminase n=1 Tax=Alkaliphilus peptidifermentans DSM 18978 TaxID=1120976 RepID=A0A1G5KVE1_9FIRM|nr:cyclodeaminase/cyclohydrolase family protein [Alkaliphilus peptidifermentans]SCZ04562.1 Formimidoyltetrahydrofolate cyclodeaminase [Alkaliphilus peptidifermentans DSM 18978]